MTRHRTDANHGYNPGIFRPVPTPPKFPVGTIVKFTSPDGDPRKLGEFRVAHPRIERTGCYQIHRWSGKAELPETVANERELEACR
jgi:hypothetical protein